MQTSLLPELAVSDGRAAVDFYAIAFGAQELYRVGGSEEHEPLVAQLSIDGASFWVADESPENGTLSPKAAGGGTVRMLLTVADPAAAMARAVTAGATEISAACQEHGWLLGKVVDPFGHQWEIGRPLIAWPPS